MEINSLETIQRILTECKTIAVVGCSSKPNRPSYGVARYMQSVGYRIIPVNPNESEVLGERAYPHLRAVPEPIDLVDIFRRSECVEPVVEEAIDLGVRAIWMQEGVYHQAAVEKAVRAGLLVVVDRCLLKEHMKRGLL